MSGRRLLSRILGVAVAAAGFAALWMGPPTVRVGLLHAQDGPLAATDGPILLATRFAIDELNARGGVLGRPIEAVVPEVGSSTEDYLDGADQLLADGVTTLFGGGPSAARRAILPRLQEVGGLLLYPHLYEGLEESDHALYLGAAANQRVVPAVTWARLEFGPRMVLIGVRGVYSEAIHAQIRDELARTRGTAVAEIWLEPGTAGGDLTSGVASLGEADVLVSTLPAAPQRRLLAQLRAQGVTTPLLSFSAAQEPGRERGEPAAGRRFVASSYVESLVVPENQDFLGAWRREHPGSSVTEPMVAAYTSVKLWAAAAEEAGTLEPARVRAAALGLAVSSPRGVDYIDPANGHAWRNLRIAEVDADGRLREVWLEPSPVPAEPWPDTRSEDAWRAILQAPK